MSKEQPGQQPLHVSFVQIIGRQISQNDIYNRKKVISLRLYLTALWIPTGMVQPEVIYEHKYILFVRKKILYKDAILDSVLHVYSIKQCTNITSCTN